MSFQNTLAKFSIEDILNKFARNFVDEGLDKIDVALKTEIESQLTTSGPSDEIRHWLDGEYLVGDECLTD